jgi:Glycosyltransferase family 87
MAGAGCATMAWLGLYGFAWNDYDTEARGAFDALVQGHVAEFLRLAPAYGGTLVERAPFALLPGLWGGGELAVYRMVALPCLLASAVLAVWLAARMRSRGFSTPARALAVGVCVANPLTLRALEVGHPEELLGGCMCVAAALLASGPSVDRTRALWAGVILGLAIANKEWALLAIGPVLLGLPAGLRRWCVITAAAVAAAVLAPLALVGSSGFLAGTRAVASSPSAIFQPWQAWWFFGHHGALVHGLFGVPKPGYRTAPAWTGVVSHPLILLVGLMLPAALWLRRRPAPGISVSRLPARAGARLLSRRDVLLALALLLLLRCVLDTWDAAYYPIPFVLALLTWEALGPADRLPVLALCSSVLAWISFQWLGAHASPDAQASFFLAWTLPLAAVLCASLFRPDPARSSGRSWILWSERGQEMTVSALDRLVRTAGAPPVTTSRSSIRTPRRPGR